MRAGFMAERVAPRAAAAVRRGGPSLGRLAPPRRRPVPRNGPRHTCSHIRSITTSQTNANAPTKNFSPQALHFVEILVGPKCTELSVERPEQYHFDRERSGILRDWLTSRLLRLRRRRCCCRPCGPLLLHHAGGRPAGPSLPCRPRPARPPLVLCPLPLPCHAPPHAQATSCWCQWSTSWSASRSSPPLWPQSAR